MYKIAGGLFALIVVVSMFVCGFSALIAFTSRDALQASAVFGVSLIVFCLSSGVCLLIDVAEGLGSTHQMLVGKQNEIIDTLTEINKNICRANLAEQKPRKRDGSSDV
jgi:hypothetical protein